MKITLKKFAPGGLYLSGPNDTLPEGFMRRYRGVSPLATNSIISRYGSALLYSLNAHSLTYFGGYWHSGVSTSLYRAAAAVKTGLSGDRLSFTVMAPVAGVEDYLFVAGGGTLFKLDSDGNDYDWGITPPSSAPTLADGGAGGSLTDGAVYKYAVTFLNSTTGHRSNPNDSSDIAITADFKVLLHGDGVDGSTTITNSISGGPAFTANGDAEIDTYKSVFGGASISFGRTAPDTGYLNAADAADFYLSAAFTISFFGRRWATTASQGWFQQRDDDDNIVMFRSTYSAGDYTHNFLIRSGAVELVNLSYTVSGFPNLGASYDYFALFTIERSGNVFTLYLNGTAVDTQTAAVAVPNLTGDFEIGRVNYGGSTVYASAFIDEFVIVNGSTVYGAAFTPPVAPFGSDEVDLAGGSTSVDLTNIPSSSDAQVDVVELWRTLGDGSIFFKLINLANGTTTYTDDIADSALQSLELPLDNLKPFDYFDDCLGPWNGSMFWLTRTEEGERGRVYYSPVGRAESVQGFIEVTSDSDGLQKLVVYAGNLFVLSKSRGFQIYGTNPYFSRELPGVPGTVAPHTVAVTPIGPMWESQDGVRVFTGGAQAQLAAYDNVKPVFRGKTVENISSFTGVVATFARGEYIISDTSQTLALNIEQLTWRDLGVGCNALAYAPESDQIAATISSTILDLEKEGTTADNAVAIAFDILTQTFNPDALMAIEMIRIEANANTETIACNAYLDDSAVAQGNLTATAGRRWTEFALNARLTERLAIRLNGSIDAAIEINTIEITYWPMVLVLFIGDNIRTVPGRLSGDKQTLTFEDFSAEQDSLQTTYIFERLFYDLNTASNNVVCTLTLINESAIALGTVNNATRTVDEINISKKGRFQKLVLAGDFTAAIALRRLELVAKPTGR